MRIDDSLGYEIESLTFLTSRLSLRRNSQLYSTVQLHCWTSCLHGVLSWHMYWRSFVILNWVCLLLWFCRKDLCVLIIEIGSLAGRLMTITDLLFQEVGKQALSFSCCHWSVASLQATKRIGWMAGDTRNANISGPGMDRSDEVSRWVVLVLWLVLGCLYPFLHHKKIHGLCKFGVLFESFTDCIICACRFAGTRSSWNQGLNPNIRYFWVIAGCRRAS